jgi:microcystin-dependent protein
MKIPIAFVICISAVQLLPAQDQCVALLRHGIYDTVRRSQSGSSVATIYNQVCSNYNSYKTGTFKANANGSYDLIPFSASVSKEDVEAIGQAMCSTNYSNDQAASNVDNFSSVVDRGAMEAFNGCMKNAKSQLVINTDYDESTPEVVTISANYSPVGNPGRQFVTGVVITDSSTNPNLKVSCSGTLYDAAQHHLPLSTSSVTMQCRRPAQNDPSKAFSILGSLPLALAFPAKVSVSTSLGPIIFSWAAIYLPPPPSPLPVAYPGEIRSIAYDSTNSSAFQALTSNGWMECAGQLLNGSDYPDLYKALGNTWGTANIGVNFKLPDLRGEFLRGWSHGSAIDPEAATRGPADPGNPHAGWTGAAGDAVGSRQQDAIVVHTHAVAGVHLQAQTGTGFDGTGTYTNSQTRSAQWEQSLSTGTPSVGSFPETRPKNIAVMYVIYTGKRHD